MQNGFYRIDLRLNKYKNKIFRRKIRCRIMECTLYLGNLTSKLKKCLDVKVRNNLGGFGMAIEDIKKELEKRFAEPLDEFYKRRIIFWNDEDGEFLDEIESLTLCNAEVLVLETGHLFSAKQLLSSTDLVTNYLVYNPLVVDPEHDWFLDIKLYSEEYRADKTSRLMQEMQIVNTAELRHVVKDFKGFFNAASRRKAIASFDGSIDKKSTLYMSILSVICGVKEREPELIIKSSLLAGVDLENTVKMDLLKYGASPLFWSLVGSVTGYHGLENMDDLVNHVVLSAVSRTMSSDVLSGLESKYSDIHSGFCYDLVFNWIHGQDKNSFRSIAEFVENNLSLLDRFNQFEIKDLEETDVLPIIDEVILSKLMYAVTKRSMDNNSIMSVIEKRRTSAWYYDYDYFYDGIYEVALMNQFYDSHLNSFHHVVAKEMWDAYTNDYYVMDSLYREFHIDFSTCLQNLHPSLDDSFKDLADYVEKEYKNWYLDKLASNWNTVIEQDLSSTGKITGLLQQTDFYQDVVRNVDGKVFVIISDAMRYDVAYALAKQLEVETTADVEISAQQGIYPTITKYGMAALLPHKDLSVVENNGSTKVLVDIHSSEMSDRDGILKSYSENSVAFKYKDLISMKRDERRAAVKGKDIIYIYHDTIDASSHNDETTVFNACYSANHEIKILVNMICSELNGLNVIITSDHGFLYTYQELNESDKMERSSFKKDIVEQGRRYVITNDSANPDFLMPVKGIYNDANLLGFAPRENIRIKGAGGTKFVHGGTSLQEMCVPIIKYKYLRTGYKAYRINKDKYDTKPVSIALLSSNRKISNMIFNLSFYQKEAVKDSYVQCTYNVYITDASGNEVSDVQKIIADKTSTVPKDREFKCTFNLKSQQFSNTETYYLVIVDEDGKQVPVKEEVQIDIAMAIGDFDFFGLDGE